MTLDRKMPSGGAWGACSFSSLTFRLFLCPVFDVSDSRFLLVAGGFQMATWIAPCAPGVAVNDLCMPQNLKSGVRMHRGLSCKDVLITR